MFFNRKKEKSKDNVFTPLEEDIAQYIPDDYELLSDEKERMEKLNNICNEYKLNDKTRKELITPPLRDMSNKLIIFFSSHSRFNGNILNDFPIEDWEYIFDFADCARIDNKEFKEVIDMCKKHDDKIYYPSVQRLLTLNRNLEDFGMDKYLSIKEFNEIYLSVIDDIKENPLYWYADNTFFTLISRKTHKEHVAIYELLFEKYKYCTRY
jgi:hypothetical protein